MMLRRIISKIRKQIVIYRDEGVSQGTLSSTVSMFKSIRGEYDLNFITAEEIQKCSLSPSETELIVIPGGADLPYQEKLEGLGNENIRKYLDQGGKYLGICAGAYYASHSIEFGVGSQNTPIIANRELGITNYKCIGPIFGFDPNTYQHLVLIDMIWKPTNTIYPSILYGGGYFKSTSQIQYEKIAQSDIINKDSYQTRILGSYYDPNTGFEYPIIIKCENDIGGVAILSSPHFEIDIHKYILDQNIEENDYLTSIIEIMKERAEEKDELRELIMTQLGI